MHVHCKIADTSWILERIAASLSERLPYVDYDTRANVAADIQYYISFHAFRGRVSPIEIAWFTHIEQDPESRTRFIETAREMTHCVCHSSPYESILREEGITEVSTIPPGVDTELFRPTVRIGVVGRVYGSGRKGERLVADVMDIEGIDWAFTGSGWPGVSRHLPSGEMARFYNSVDYVLVPSLIEAGPMSVVEALACGRPVIAPPVGWVPKFPHIEYATGDADDLRRVLREIVEERQGLRDHVLQMTWDAFADTHDRLFWELGRSRGLAPPRPEGRASPDRVHLLLPGQERSARGGPSIRIPELARRLRRSGMEIYALHGDAPSRWVADIVHAVNINPLAESGPLLAGARRAVDHVVFSPIYLDRSDHAFYSNELPELGTSLLGEGRDAFADALRRDYTSYRESRRGPDARTARAVADLLAQADSLVCLSELERSRLSEISDCAVEATIVENPVDVERWSDADPALFRAHVGADAFVLCVGRVEPRKNQLALSVALAGAGVPLVLIGSAHDADYLETCRGWLGDDLILVDHLPNDGDLLASAYAAAGCFALPSWTEGAPIAALEAAAAGARLVLSSASAEREYFGDHAEYVDPWDVAAIRDRTLSALRAPRDPGRRARQIEHVRARFDYDVIADRTQELYEALLERSRAGSSKIDTIFFDVSQNAHTRGTPTGTCRVELEIARHMRDAFHGDVRFVVWNRPNDEFVECSYRDIVDGNLEPYATYEAMSLRGGPAFATDRRYDDAALVVLGGSWIGNARFTRLLTRAVLRQGLSLRLLVHDTMQAKLPWYPASQKELFSSNLATLLSVADQVFGNSRCTCSDISEFAEERRIVIAPPRLIEFGQEAPASPSEPEPSGDGSPPWAERSSLADELGEFVLYVAAIDVRKNHSLLFRLWKDMIARGVDRGVKLVCVGRKGWSHERILEDAESLGASLVILEGVQDEQLLELYDRALFCVHPSLYEGWGLPVSEALALGKVTVVSNRGSLPEVQPAATICIDPDDFPSWRDTVTSLINSPAFRERMAARVRREFRARSWRQTAEDLARELSRVAPGRARLRPLGLDELISLSECGLGLGALEGDWSRIEAWGLWTDGEEARIRVLDAEVTSRESLDLHLAYRVFRRRGHPPHEVDVRFNGETLRTLRSDDGARRGTLDVTVGRDLIERRAFPELELVVRGAVPPSSVGTGSETRALGIGLEEVLVGWLESSQPGARTKGGVLGAGEQLQFRRADGRRKDPRVGRAGWTSPDRRGVWARRENAALFLHLDPALTETDLLIAIAFRGASRDYALPPLEVEISCEDEMLQTLLIQPRDREPPRRRIHVPREVHHGRNPLKLGVRTKRLWKASESGNTSDRRRLGVGVYSLEVRAAEPDETDTHDGRLSVGDPRCFTSGDAALGLLGGGWARAESWGVWSCGPVSELRVPIAAARDRPLELFLEGRAHVGSRNWALWVAATINGEAADEWVVRFDPDDRWSRAIPLRPGWAASGLLTVRLTFDGAVSRERLGLGEDRRELGLGLERLMLRERSAPRATRGFSRLFDAIWGTPARGTGVGTAATTRPSPAGATEALPEAAYVQAVTLAFLGRFLNENDDVHERIALGRTELVRRVLLSSECAERVVPPLAAGEMLPQVRYQPTPSRWLREAIAQIPSLTAEAVPRIRRAASWNELLSTILSDDGFSAEYLDASGQSERMERVALIRQAARATEGAP